MVSLDYIDSVSDSQLELDCLAVQGIFNQLHQTGSYITYGELAKYVGTARGRQMSSQGFASSLGRIQHYCEALGLPCLPVTVVSTNSNAVGEGFFNCYRELHPKATNLSEYEIRVKERKAIIASKDWQKLYDYLGISEAAPAIRDTEFEVKARKYIEGQKTIQSGLKDELYKNNRDPKASAMCLSIKGTTCTICGFDSEKIYGVPGLIHVHHLNPISNGKRETDPIKDLVPLCPNCHAFVHSKSKSSEDSNVVYTVNEVREILGLEPLEDYE